MIKQLKAINRVGNFLIMYRVVLKYSFESSLLLNGVNRCGQIRNSLNVCDFIVYGCSQVNLIEDLKS